MAKKSPKVARAKRIAELARDLETLESNLEDLKGGREFRISHVRYGITRDASVGAFDCLTSDDRVAINKYIAGKLRARKRTMESELAAL